MIVLTIIGGIAASFLVPTEQASVREYLIGFPDADAITQHLRPVILGALCFVPALMGLYYALADTLDRYFVRQFLSAFFICFAALYSIWLVIDLSDNLGHFREGGASLSFVLYFYLVQFPYAFLELIPFGLLLSLLYCLGKMSKSQEIIGMIQTGRSVARIIFPVVVIGGLISLICLGFNYHWGPWAAGYQDALVEQATRGTTSKARNVFYHDSKSKRFWFIGSFPYDYAKGEPLRDIEVRTFSPEHTPEWKLRASEAHWDQDTGSWRFVDPVITHLNHRLGHDGPLLPRYEVPSKDLVITSWGETPWQLVKPGLSATNLGIPDLKSWLNQNKDNPWANKRPFQTQWHYRWAQPWICLAIILLSAPLGVVFSRRGTIGGVAMAVFLSIGMMFSATVFLSLGESNHLPPMLAAWATNLLAFSLAFILIQRRLSGRPIYQTIKKLFLPFGD